MYPSDYGTCNEGMAITLLREHSVIGLGKIKDPKPSKSQSDFNALKLFLACGLGIT